MTGSTQRHAPLDRRIVLLGMGLLFLADVLSRPFMPPFESHYLSVAWEMHLNHNWLVPTDNWQTYSHKPPMMFWLMNLAWLPGVTETGARLVAPAFCLLGLWLTGRLGDRMGGRATGDAAVMILAGSAPLYFFGARTAFDGALTVATILAALALWRIGTRDDPAQGVAPWIGLGAAIALGVYSKGPVIFLHVAPMLLGLRWWAGAGRFSWGGLAVALATALGLVGLWLVPALILGGPTYRYEVLWMQSAGRVVDSFAHERPFWFYATILPLFLFPWIFLTDFWQRKPLDTPERFLWLWAAGGFLILSLVSAKQAHYALPQLPAVALLFARRWPAQLSRPWATLIGLGVLLAGFAAVAFGAFGTDMAALVPVWLVPVLAVPLIVAGAVMWRAPNCAFLLVPALVLALVLGYATGPAGDILASKQLAQRLTPFDGRVAVRKGIWPYEFIFAGRLTHPITVVADADDIAAFADAGPEGRIVAPLDSGPKPDWPPLETLRYRTDGYGTYGIWSTHRP